MLNANLQEELAAPQGLNPRGSVHRRQSVDSDDVGGGIALGDALGPTPAPEVVGGGAASLHAALLQPPGAGCAHPPSMGACVRGLKWWGWQPHSLLFWGSFVQLLGAFAFNVSCFGGLPGMAHGHAAVARLTTGAEALAES